MKRDTATLIAAGMALAAIAWSGYRIYKAVHAPATSAAPTGAGHVAAVQPVGGSVMPIVPATPKPWTLDAEIEKRKKQALELLGQISPRG